MHPRHRTHHHTNSSFGGEGPLSLLISRAILQKAWRAIIDRHLAPVDLAALGQMPVTEAEVLALARDAWKDPAFRNQKKIAWQTWAQQKYRKLASDRRTPSTLTTNNDANKHQ